MSDELIIEFDGKPYAMPCEPRSDATDPTDRYEENLHLHAKDTLENIRRQYGAAAMMHALKPVAAHFDVDPEALLALPPTRDSMDTAHDGIRSLNCDALAYDLEKHGALTGTSAKATAEFLRDCAKVFRALADGRAAVRSVDSLRPPDPWSIPFECHAKDCIVRVHAHVGLRAPLGTYHVWERTVTCADILSPDQTLLDLVNAKPCRCGADSVAAPEETKHE